MEAPQRGVANLSRFICVRYIERESTYIQRYHLIFLKIYLDIYKFK
jgi:hypothetical protein